MTEIGRILGERDRALVRTLAPAPTPPPVISHRVEGPLTTKLFKAHLGTLRYHAKRYSRGNKQLEAELLQEGALGMVKAAEKFNPKKANYNTYATWWIKAYMSRYVSENVGSIVRSNGHSIPSDIQIDAPPHEMMPAPKEYFESNDPSIEDETLSGFKSARVRAKLELIRARVGELGWELINERLCSTTPLTLGTFAERHGVSRERVRQIELRLVGFLRSYLLEFSESGGRFVQIERQNMQPSRLRKNSAVVKHDGAMRVGVSVADGAAELPREESGGGAAITHSRGRDAERERLERVKRYFAALEAGRRKRTV